MYFSTWQIAVFVKRVVFDLLIMGIIAFFWTIKIVEVLVHTLFQAVSRKTERGLIIIRIGRFIRTRFRFQDKTVQKTLLKKA